MKTNNVKFYIDYNIDNSYNDNQYFGTIMTIETPKILLKDLEQFTNFTSELIYSGRLDNEFENMIYKIGEYYPSIHEMNSKVYMSEFWHINFDGATIQLDMSEYYFINVLEGYFENEPKDKNFTWDQLYLKLLDEIKDLNNKYSELDNKVITEILISFEIIIKRED